ncbi:unnamed protein product [Caretta caretta]
MGDLHEVAVEQKRLGVSEPEYRTGTGLEERSAEKSSDSLFFRYAKSPIGISTIDKLHGGSHHMWIYPILYRLRGRQLSSWNSLHLAQILQRMMCL